MYFPVSGVEVFPLIPVAVAFVISFFCSMGGVSGAFLLLPFQVSALGFTSPAVSPTNHVYNVVSTPGGVWRFIREGRMLWPLALVVALGSIPGTLAGSVIRVTCLPDVQHFKLFAAAVLMYIGLSMVWTLLRSRKKEPHQKSAPEAVAENTVADPGGAKAVSANSSSPDSMAAGASPVVHMREFSLKTISYDFMGEVYSASTKGVFLLCFVVGIVGGAYGIGGGAIIAPFLVSFFRLPVYTISGTTLLGNFLTSLSALLFFLGLSSFFPGEPVSPDWSLGLLFGLGGLLGIYCGARAQRFVPERHIKILLAVILVGTAIRYVFEALG
jgi:uncharacterized membrane protein YfcA